MRRIKASWAPALLLMSAVAVNATLDLHNVNTDPRVQGKRVENLISGVDRTQKDIPKANNLDPENIAARQAPNAGLDISSVLDSFARDQGDTQKDDEQNTGRDGAAALDGQSQGTYRNQTIPKEQGKGDAKTSTDNALLLEVKSSIATEANGQLLPTAVVEPAGKQREPASIPETTLTEVLPSIQGNPSAPVVAESSSPAASTSAIVTAPKSQISPESQNYTAAIESSKAMAKPELSASSVEGLNATTPSPETSTIPAFQLLPTAKNSTSAAAVTVSAKKGPPATAKSTTITSSANATSINSATLTADGLAATTTTAVGAAVIIDAGSSGATNCTSSPMNTKISTDSSSSVSKAAIATSPSSTVAAAVPEDAGSGLKFSFSLDLSSTSISETAAVAGTNASSAAPVSKTIHTTMYSTTTHTTAITIVASADTALSSKPMGSGFTYPSASNSTSTTSKATGATPIASPGGGIPAGIVGNASAANNGGCHCACACPAGTFPMAAPPAPPAFQLGPLLGMSTMQTVVKPSASAGTGVSSISSSATSVNLTTVALPPTVATTSTSSSSSTSSAKTAPPASSLPSSRATPQISPPTPSSSESAAATTPSPSPSPSTSPTPSPAPSSADDVAPPASPQDPPQTTTTAAQQQQGNGLPFDINTITLVSRVTVNLGRRWDAEVTGGV